MIELEPGGANLFYWSLAGCSAAFVLLGLWGLAAGSMSEKHLVVDERGLLIPSRWTARTRLIPYSAIRGMALVRSRTFANRAPLSRGLPRLELLSACEDDAWQAP